jgi:hypothetical protein
VWGNVTHKYGWGGEVQGGSVGVSRGVQATVDCFDRLESVPSGYWTITLTDNLEAAQGDGIHQDQNGQPFTLAEPVRAGRFQPVMRLWKC